VIDPVSGNRVRVYSNRQSRTDSNIDERLYRQALDALPSLTRAVLLLSSRHELSYDEIGWCCGISSDEVMVRIGNALLGIDRHLSGVRTPIGLLRRALSPCRRAWAAARVREGDRKLGLSRSERRNTPLDWAARALNMGR
jgi:hypothetical protein